MKLETWLPMYHDICREFGYDEDADSACALLLSDLLATHQVPSVEELRAGCPREVTVCGDGPFLAEIVSAERPQGYVVAADGAATVLAEEGILPDAIVTDLDGDVEHQVRANAKGSLVFVHAHGDNADVVRTVVPRFKGRVVGTCQGPPDGDLLNLGGFTDGDRAACIFSGLGAEKFVLVGFDFERPTPKPSRPREEKLRKLTWAKRILEMLAEQGVQLDGL